MSLTCTIVAFTRCYQPSAIKTQPYAHVLHVQIHLNSNTSFVSR